MRAALFSLTLACLVTQGFPHTARAALGASSDSVESDRVAMKGLVRPTAAGALQKQDLQLPSGTVVTEYLNSQGTVYAVTWHGPSLPNLRQILGSYFVNYQTAAQTPVVRHRLVRVNSADLVIESSGRMRAFVGRAWVPALLPSGVTAAEIQ